MGIITSPKTIYNNLSTYNRLLQRWVRPSRNGVKAIYIGFVLIREVGLKSSHRFYPPVLIPNISLLFCVWEQEESLVRQKCCFHADSIESSTVPLRVSATTDFQTKLQKKKKIREKLGHYLEFTSNTWTSYLSWDTSNIRVWKCINPNSSKSMTQRQPVQPRGSSVKM